MQPLHTIANTKKKTRIQDTRLSQLSLISFRYQQNLRSIFRHSWQLSIITRIFLFFLVNRWCTNDIKLVKHIRLSQSENRQNCTKRKRARDWTGRGEVLVNEKLNRVSSIARFYGRLFYPNRWIRQLRVGKRKKKYKKKDRSSYTNRHELYSTLDRYLLARLNRSSITPLTETTDLLDLPYSHALVIRFFSLYFGKQSRYIQVLCHRYRSRLAQRVLTSSWFPQVRLKGNWIVRPVWLDFRGSVRLIARVRDFRRPRTVVQSSMPILSMYKSCFNVNGIGE